MCSQPLSVLHPQAALAPAAANKLVPFLAFIWTKTSLRILLLACGCFVQPATGLTQPPPMALVSAAPPIDSLPDRSAVIEPIQRLFTAMQQSDTIGLAAIFHPDARLSSLVKRPDKTELQSTEIATFIHRIANTQAGALLEELHYTEVRIDGDLATAWTPYTFFFQGNLSHCGTNSFQLARTGSSGTWQIYSILDSRYPEDCPPVATQSPVDRLNQLADDWHQAATDADAERYFGLMTPDAIFIGTDPSEHWTKSDFLAFAKPYFDKGTAWDFQPIERHLFIFPDENTAYWDELLQTWMGPCRGTGIASRQHDGSWLLKHYTLSVTVPNDKIQAFLAIPKD